MLKNIRGLLGFSKSEMNAVLILVPLIILFVFFPTIYRLNHNVAYDPSSDQALLDSILIQLRYVDGEEPNIDLFFEFDPNRLSTDSLKLLGIPAFLSSRIDNYRKAGGRFREVADIKRIYDFPDSLYEKLSSWIRIVEEEMPKPAQSSVTNHQSFPKVDSSIPKVRVSEEVKHERADMVIVNVNAADTSAFKALKGIGSVFANRIVKYRALLGGYYDISQIKEVYGLSDSLFMALLPHLNIEVPPQLQKLEINFASFKVLNAHPYISYEQTKEILNQKSRLGKYSGTEDLIKLKTFDSAAVVKILPYLDFR